MTDANATGTRVHNGFKEFIGAWEGSNSVQEAADKLGITKESAGQRASAYRGKDIKLKKMPRGGAKLDISEAQSYLADLQSESNVADEANAEISEVSEV